jgi:hypothetical protein
MESRIPADRGNTAIGTAFQTARRTGDQMTGWKTAKQKQDETYTDDPRFRLWRPEDE